MAGPAAGRVPATHDLQSPKKDVDGRDKHGQDDEEESRASFSQPDFPNRTVVGLARPPTKGLPLRRLDANNLPMQGGWVYIMTNRPNGTLYVGVTSDLARRVWEHREGVAEGFTKKYGLKRLIYAERHEDIRTAIQREKNLKHWPRAWKVRLVHAENPNWDDLTSTSGWHRWVDIWKTKNSWVAGPSPAMTK